jgi:hypothetical protein
VTDPGGWEEVERAEARLDQRAQERATRRRWRRRSAAVVRWFALLALPAIGSAALTTIIEAAGGDLGGWSEARAAAVVLGAFVLPALLAAWVWRRRGVVSAAAAALAVLFVTIGLTFGVAFTLLGYGP